MAEGSEGAAGPSPLPSPAAVDEAGPNDSTTEAGPNDSTTEAGPNDSTTTPNDSTPNDSTTSLRCVRETLRNVNTWYEHIPRLATETDCRFLCFGPDLKQWCSAYQFSAEENGSCKVFDDSSCFDDSCPGNCTALPKAEQAAQQKAQQNAEQRAEQNAERKA